MMAAMAAGATASAKGRFPAHVPRCRERQHDEGAECERSGPQAEKKQPHVGEPDPEAGHGQQLAVAGSEAPGQVEHEPHAEQDDANEEMRPQRAERSNYVGKGVSHEKRE